MDNNQDAPLKIIINGQEEELSPSEAAELINTGRQTRDLETKYNTKLDKVWPEYNRSQQELSQTKVERDEAKKQLEDFRSKQEEGTETPLDVKQAKEAARALGLTLKEDLATEGFIKQTDLDKYFEEREAKKRAQEQVLADADKLVTQIDGTDGRPAFNKKAVLAYASTYRKTDGQPFATLQEAYEDMNQDKITQWQDQQIQSKKAKELKTLRGSGDKTPKTPRITDDNFKEALREAMSGGNEE